MSMSWTRLLLLLFLDWTCTASTRHVYHETSVSGQSPELMATSLSYQHVSSLTDHWSSTASLCNDYNHVSGSEGAAVPGYSLRQIHVLLTPGETTLSSDSSLASSGSVNYQFVVKSADNKKIKSLQEAFEVYQKLQRNKHAFKGYSFLSSSQHSSGNNLTGRGTKQHVAVGEFLHGRYFRNHEAQHKFQPVSDQVRAECATESSSFQSLIAYLHGFLPEKEFIKTALHKTVNNFCSTEESDLSTCHCPSTASLQDRVERAFLRGTHLHKGTFPQPDVLKSILQGMFAKQSNLSPVDLLKLSQLHICNNESLLCDELGNCLYPNQQIALVAHVTSFYQRLLADHTLVSYCRLQTYPFLRRLAHRSVAAETDRQIYLYSTDQILVPCVLTSLGLSFDHFLPPASRLVFEVYQSKQNQISRGQMFLRVLLNGREVTSQIKACRGQLDGELCQLEAFIEGHLQQNASYKTECWS